MTQEMTQEMTEIDKERAYGFLDDIQDFLGHIRSTLQDLDAADADSVFDARRDCHIRIQNVEGKLAGLKAAVGPDPLAATDGPGNGNT